jgi:hypothetical protein
MGNHLTIEHVVSVINNKAYISLDSLASNFSRGNYGNP